MYTIDSRCMHVHLYYYTLKSHCIQIYLYTYTHTHIQVRVLPSVQQFHPHLPIRHNRNG